MRGNMRINRKAIIRRGREFLLGKLTSKEFKTEATYKTPYEVEGFEEFFNEPGKAFKLMGISMSQKDIKDFMKLIGCSEMWIFDPIPQGKGPENEITERQWEEYWWKYKHPLCNSCAKECKQSSRVELEQCPGFKKS
jgi:hypothetical protein